jgi:hypothetical protein
MKQGQKYKRAVVFFITEELDEYTDFKTQTGCFDLSDLISLYPTQYLHIEQEARLYRELEALGLLINNGMCEAVLSRFNKSRVKPY